MVSFEIEEGEESGNMAEQLNKNGKRFPYDSDSTVRDLLQRITQLLTDAIGDGTASRYNAEYGLFLERRSKKNPDKTLSGTFFLLLQINNLF